MRKKLAIANWKMNFTRQEALDFVEAFALPELGAHTEVVLCTPFVYIHEVGEKARQKNLSLHLGAQDVSTQKSGAYTGEIAAPMLASLLVRYCIVGHSERRQYFGENDEMLAKKIDQLDQQNITPVFCVGESLDIREKGNHFSFVEQQLQGVYQKLTAPQIQRLVIAYEPIWAIGTGKTASPQEAEAIHAFIRQWIAKNVSQEVAEQTSILYGGSVKPDNATELFSCPNIDGGLVGGASLDPKGFAHVAESLAKA